MPIQSGFISHNRPAKFFFPKQIPAGEVSFAQDRSEEITQYIVALCHDTLYRGMDIFILDEEDFLIDEDGKIAIKVDLDEPDYAILPGFAFTKEIVDYEDERGMIVFQHYFLDKSGNIFTQTLN